MRNELNSIEKMARMQSDISSDSKSFVMNGETAEKILHREKQNKFNDSVQEYIDKFEKHNQALNEYAKQISEDINGLEIMPLGNYALIKPFDNNPFQKIRTTASGIITDIGGMNIGHKSQETGEEEEDVAFVKVGTVIETGYDCRFLKAGDLVMYTIASEMMVPFYGQGFVVVAEPRIMAVINEKLTERKNSMKK